MSKPLLPSEKEVLLWQDKSEKAVLKALEKHYQAALKSIEMRITEMMARNDADLPHVIRRIEYQRIIKAQVKAAIDMLHAQEYETIQEYLNGCYTDAFVGNIYTLHHQNMPVILPIDQTAVVKAVTIDSKLKSDLYTALGLDLTQLKKTIAAEITRGIASGLLYTEMVRNLANASGVPLSRARTIVRTEGGRVQEQATFDAQQAAKAKGADVVSQWSSIRDGKTRPTHRMLDGQIREVGEYFEVEGKRAKHPHGFGLPEEDINCRCTLLTRARSAMDADELARLEKIAYQHSLLVKDSKEYGQAKAKDFADFKKKYLKAAETVENTGKSGIIKKGNLAVPQLKLTGYALDPIRQPDKAKAFKRALGYVQSNADALIENILENADESKFVEKGDAGYGMLYQFVMRITGPNGKEANVLTAWIADGEQKRLTSVYVTEKKVTE